MTDDMEQMDEMDRSDNAELERRLQAYAAARLSPDQWASVRMRAAVIEHGHAARTRRPARFSWRPLRRPLVLIGLVAALAVGTGASAAFAASPGGPLYGARLWVESAVLAVTGAGASARASQMTDRIDEITQALDAGNVNAADAAANAYGSEVDAAAQAAQNRADLVALRTAVARHLAHLQGMTHANPKAQANLDRAVADAKAALAEIDRKLAALPAPSPTP